MKRTEVTEPPECSSRCAASSQTDTEEEITELRSKRNLMRFVVVLLISLLFLKARCWRKLMLEVARVDVNPDDVDEVVDELMDDLWGNVNAPRRAYSSSMTPRVFLEYHREIMEGIRALRTLGHARTNQLRSIATTGTFMSAAFTVRSVMRAIFGTLRIALSAISLVFLTPVRPSSPRPRAHLGWTMVSKMILIRSSSLLHLLFSLFSFSSF
ncbi:hypothetical protein Dimus_008589 [Dionaea muscipula]